VGTMYVTRPVPGSNPTQTWPGPCHCSAGQSCGRAACKVFGPGGRAGYIPTAFTLPGVVTEARAGRAAVRGPCQR
jgi:hypothetical protein